MPDMPQRLARLRAIAKDTDEAAREEIEHLLGQTPASPDVHCPRFAGIAEIFDLKLIIADEDPLVVATRLCSLATAEVPHQPDAIIDLDTGERHHAHRTMHLSFRPPLPGVPQEPVVALPVGTRSALRLLLEIAEEHSSNDKDELREAIAIGDELLARIRRLGDSTRSTGSGD